MSQTVSFSQSINVNIFNENKNKKQTICVALGVQLTRLLDLLRVLCGPLQSCVVLCGV